MFQRQCRLWKWPGEALYIVHRYTVSPSNSLPLLALQRLEASQVLSQIAILPVVTSSCLQEGIWTTFVLPFRMTS
jgi:hypothetical protein